MSVADLAVRIVYEESADPDTLYAIPFQFLETSQVVVSRSVDGGAFETLSAGYAVDGDGRAAPPTGTVQISEPVEGAQLAIARVTAREQPVDYTERGDFPSDFHQDAADRTVMVVQEQAAELGRAIRLPAGVEGPEIDLADFAGGKVLGVNADGDAIVPVTVTEAGDVDTLGTLGEEGGDEFIKTVTGRNLAKVLAALPQVLKKPLADVTSMDVDGDSFSLASYPHDTSGQSVPTKAAALLSTSLTTRATSGYTSADLQYNLFSTGTVLRDVPADAGHLGVIAAGHNDVIHLSTGGDRPARIRGLSRIRLANHLWKAKPAGTNKIKAAAASAGQLAVAGSWVADTDVPGAFKATVAEAAMQATFSNCRYAVAFYKVKIGSTGVAAIRMERDESNLDIFSAAPEAGWIPTNISRDWAIEARWFDAGEVLPELLMQFKVHGSTGGGAVSFIGFAGFDGEIGDDYPMAGFTDVSRWPQDAYDAVSGSAANMRVINEQIAETAGVVAQLGGRVIKLPMASVIGPSFGLVGGTNFHYNEAGAVACAQAWVDAIESPAPYAADNFGALVLAMMRSGGSGVAPGMPLAFGDDLRLLARALGGGALLITSGDNQVKMEAGVYLVPKVAGAYNVANALLLTGDGSNCYGQARVGRFVVKAATGNGYSFGPGDFRPEDANSFDLGTSSNPWKRGYFGSAGVFVSGTKVLGAQGASLPADASDLATAITLVNAIKARGKRTGGHGLWDD